MSETNMTDTTERDDTSGEQLQLVTFTIGSEEYAVDILRVQEINRMLPITAVPEGPDWVEGVINLRGRIIPIVDLRKRFGSEITETDELRIVVVDIRSHVTGCIVDGVNEVLRLDASIVDPPPSMSSRPESDYIKGVGKLEDRLLILLDLDRLIDEDACSAPRIAA